MIKSFCQPRKRQMAGHQVIHEFLYIPECPVPLLGPTHLEPLELMFNFTLVVMIVTSGFVCISLITGS